MSETKKFKAQKYIHLPKKVLEVLWNHNIYGRWVWVKMPKSKALNAGMTNDILFEMFDIANDVYQNDHKFSFIKKVGTVSEIAGAFGCSNALASTLRRKAQNKWKYFYHLERKRRSKLKSAAETEIFFNVRGEMMSWADNVDLSEDDIESKKAIHVNDNMSGGERGYEIIMLAIESLLDVRGIKERRIGRA